MQDDSIDSDEELRVHPSQVSIIHDLSTSLYRNNCVTLPPVIIL